MEEKLKIICQNNLQNFKDNFFADYLSGKNRDGKGVYYDLYMEIQAQHIIDEILSQEFKIYKFNINSEFASKNLSMIKNNEGNYAFDLNTYDIILYYFQDLNKTLVFINENDSSFDGGKEYVFEYICDNIDELEQELNNTYGETYLDIIENIIKSDLELFKISSPLVFLTNMLTYTNAEVIETKAISTLYNYLTELYKDDNKVQSYLQVIEQYRIQYIELLQSANNDIIKKNQQEFNLGLWRNVYREFIKLNNIRNTIRDDSNNIKVRFSDKDLVKIEKGLLNSKNINKISKMLYTFLYTKNMFDKVSKDGYDYFDLTFITVSLFKVAEILFNEFLNRKWPDKKIVDENGFEIYFSKNDLTLGNMNQIFSKVTNAKIPEEIIHHIKSQGERSMELKILLQRWISKTRNGFLHKDIIDIQSNMIDMSIKDSLAIICLLILVFED